MRLALIAALALLLTTAADAQTAPGFINAAASQLAGRTVTVQCQSSEDTLADRYMTPRVYAYVLYYETDGVVGPGDVAQFRGDVCYALVRLHGGRLVHIDQAAEALLILAHESGHLRGMYGESEAECWALPRVGLTARLIAPWLTPSQTARLVRTARGIHRSLAPEYRSGC